MRCARRWCRAHGMRPSALTCAAAPWCARWRAAWGAWAQRLCGPGPAWPLHHQASRATPVLLGIPLPDICCPGMWAPWGPLRAPNWRALVNGPVFLPMNTVMRMLEHAIRSPPCAGRAIGGGHLSRASGAAATTAMAQPQRTAVMRRLRRQVGLARARQAAMSAWAWRLLAIGSHSRHRWAFLDVG